VRGEAGAIKSLDNRTNAALGIDSIRLTDRFYLGEPQMRGFDIRGVGPRVLRQFITDDGNGNPVVVTDRNKVVDDALGGKYYYLGHVELEIPLGSGARDMGIRPSIFMDIGSVWGIKAPVEQISPYPGGIFVPARDPAGAALYTQINSTVLDTSTSTPVCNVTAVAQVTSPTSTVVLPCLPVGVTAGVNTRSAQPFRLSRSSSLAIHPSRVFRSASGSTGIRRSGRSGSTLPTP
jgi:outer membrane protein insertion porin family